MKSIDEHIEIIGCQPRNSAVMYESIKTGGAKIGLERLKEVAQSKVTLFILFVLIIWSLFISRLLTLLAIFFFCVVVIYQVSLYREKKAQAESKPAND